MKTRSPDGPPTAIAAAPPAATSATVTAPRLARAAAAGAASGVVGTLVMSMLMLPAQWIGLLGTQPPRRIADRTIAAMGIGSRASERHRRVMTTVTHLTIGAAGGALLGIARLLTHRRGSAPLVGLAFGTGLWAVNYVAVAPALELFPPPDRDRPGRPPVMLTANAVYGAVTATLTDALLDGGR